MTGGAASGRVHLVTTADTTCTGRLRDLPNDEHSDRVQHMKKLVIELVIPTHASTQALMASAAEEAIRAAIGKGKNSGSIYFGGERVATYNIEEMPDDIF